MAQFAAYAPFLSRKIDAIRNIQLTKAGQLSADSLESCDVTIRERLGQLAFELLTCCDTAALASCDVQR
jgi:hypothetical protein